MTLVRWDPFGMLRDFDRVLEREWPSRERTWLPRVDVIEEEGALVVRAETPGADDIDVTVEDGRLAISGSRSFASESSAEGYRRKEIFEGTFRRSLHLPESADVENISAASKDGILEVRVPLLAEALPKKVTVEVQS